MLARTRAVLDLQVDPEHGGIGLGDVVALRQVAAGLRIERIEPNTAVGGLLTDALGPAPRAELLHVLMLPDFERPIVARPYVTTIRSKPLKVRAALDEAGGVARPEEVCLPCGQRTTFPTLPPRGIEARPPPVCPKVPPRETVPLRDRNE